MKRYLKQATKISSEYPVVISKFITEAREIDLDGITNNGSIIMSILSEHIENAGIHSGDATSVIPAQRVYSETSEQIKMQLKKLHYTSN